MKTLFREVESLYEIVIEKGVSLIENVKMQIVGDAGFRMQKADLLLIADNLIVLQKFLLNQRQSAIQIPSQTNSVSLINVNHSYTCTVDKIRVYQNETDISLYMKSAVRFLHTTFSFEFSNESDFNVFLTHLGKYYSEHIR